MTNRFVEKLQGFGTLTPQDVAALIAATSAPRSFAARRDLIREGDSPDRCSSFWKVGRAGIKSCPAAPVRQRGRR